MSAASRRGSNLIRQQIADEQKDSAYWVGRVTAEANRADRAEQRLKEAREEIAVAQLQEQQREQQTLLDKITKLESDLQKSRDEAHRWMDLYFQKNRGHAKLSMIVRMAMSPEEYHAAREDAARVHPNLFKEKG